MSSLKGRTYEEIYGPEKAEAGREDEMEFRKLANGPVATVIVYGLDTEKERTSVHYDEGRYEVWLEDMNFESNNKQELMKQVAEYVERAYPGFHVNFSWTE